MAVRHGRALWPGVRSPVSCTYTLSHGVSPSAAVLRINPQPGVPYAAEGPLVITDGVGTVVLRDCKVDRVEEKRNASGVVWDITIMDRRWRWRDCGGVSLWANQLDPQGKFIPWTVASPVEIATLCLQVMGERRFTIDLPTGLTSAAAAVVKEFLPTGVNFPPSGVNPPIDWYAVKPMVVLEQLAEMFGRVVVWRWDTDSVHVVQKGSGGPLPPGSISSRCPGVDAPETPDGVVVVGAPTRYQPDLDLTAMGEEWDGRYVPINSLSYAPVVLGAKHKVEVTGAFDDDFRYYVTVNGVPFASAAGGGYANLNAVLTAIAADITASADPLVKGKVRAAVAGNVLTVEAVAEGPPFELAAYTHHRVAPGDPVEKGPAFNAAVKVVGKKGGKSWARSWPPMFPGVRATPRLTLGQARDLARKSVWKYFTLSGRDVSGKGGILVPGFGRAQKYQLLLQDTQCEQIVPEAPDFKVRLKNGLGDPLVQNFYNGLSKDKPAACFGAVNSRAASQLFLLDRAKALNTGADDQVQVPFTIDPLYHMVKFSAPVYYIGKGYNLEEPTLRLRCAVNVREVNTNAFNVYTLITAFPGGRGKDFVFERHDDVQLNVIPTYDARGKVTNVRLLEADPLVRAGYYRDGMVFRYQYKASLVNTYNGIVPGSLDGAVSQITWTVGEGGADTTMSLNHEHNTALPPFPARRRAELLRAAVGPGGFLGQVGDRKPNQIVPFQNPKA